jgi:MFS family permease
VIAATDTTSALWVNAASFIVSAGIVAILIPAVAATRTSTPSTEEPDGTAMSRYIADFKEGLSFIHRDPLTMAIVVAVATTNFLDAMIGLVYPVYAEQVFDSAVALGLLMAAFGIGAVGTTLAFAAIGHRMPRRETFISCFVLSAVLIFPLAFTPPLLVCLIVMAAKGASAGPLNPILMTLSQERIPVELRGRVFGVLTALSWIAIPAGRLGAGFLIEGIGLIPTVVAVATAYVAVTLGMFMMPALRQMNTVSPILTPSFETSSTPPRQAGIPLAEGRD